MLILIATMMAAGLAAGVLAGFLGVGGGIILVPILFHCFGALGVDEALRMHLAVGTSLATIIPTSIRSVLGHHAKGAVDLDVLRRWALPVVLGVAMGSLTAGYASGLILSLIFVIVGFGVAAYLGFAPETMRLGAALPGEPARSGMGVGIGFFSTLMGIGGGTFGVSLLTLFGTPMHRAVGTASGLGLLISVPGTIGFILAGWTASGLPAWSLGFVNLMSFAVIIPMTVAAVPIGVRIAHAISRESLRRAFAIFLAFNAALILVEVLNGI